MKTLLIAVTFSFLSSYAEAGDRQYTCENGNIQFAIRESMWSGSIKYSFIDKKRGASATFERSSYTFDAGDIINLEMYPSSNNSYTAVIEDYPTFKKLKAGTTKIPMLLIFQNRSGVEVHQTVYCDRLS